MINHIRQQDLKTATWAGGTTTQLAIRPLTAEYQKFNFDFRVSYATVEIEESTFTFMPGVTRHLMILEGELNIDHIDRYSKELKRFDVDTFDGEWPTQAKGKVKDLNLMTRGSFYGSLKSITVKDGTPSIFSLNNFFTGVFIISGSIDVKFNDRLYSLGNGDFLEFENESGDIQLISKGISELVVSQAESK